MVIIALIAVGLWAAIWWDQTGLTLQSWWNNYKSARRAQRREKLVQDAWNGPITLQAARRENLESVLKRLKAAMERPPQSARPWIYVDTGALREAGRTLDSAIGTEIDARGIPAREFLQILLKPLGLACKLDDGAVMVTSGLCLDEPVDYGHHGEVFCNHGERALITDDPPGPRELSRDFSARSRPFASAPTISESFHAGVGPAL
jgi:hypothetical protein